MTHASVDLDVEVGDHPSNSVFVTGTMLMMPGLRPIAMPPVTGVVTGGISPSGRGEATSTPPSPTDGETPPNPPDLAVFGT
jgi:hypothetical protein